MTADRSLPDPVTVGDLSTFAAALLLERADIERRYFTGKFAALQIIRGGHPDVSSEEVEAGAKADAWAAIAVTLRTALYGGPDLDDGNHFAGMPPRQPGIHRLTVVGQKP